MADHEVNEHGLIGVLLIGSGIVVALRLGVPWAYGCLGAVIYVITLLIAANDTDTPRHRVSWGGHTFCALLGVGAFLHPALAVEVPDADGRWALIFITAGLLGYALPFVLVRAK